MAFCQRGSPAIICSYAADLEALMREGFLHHRATQAIFCKIDGVA
jgi:hypothetical protein